MSHLNAIRCTVNSESITEADLINAASEIAAEIDEVTVAEIADACDLPADCPAITDAVVETVALCRHADLRAQGLAE